jgi:hypothetical protein
MYHLFVNFGAGKVHGKAIGYAIWTSAFTSVMKEKRRGIVGCLEETINMLINFISAKMI